MSITAPTGSAGGEVTLGGTALGLPAAASWLPALLGALPDTSAVLFDQHLTIVAGGGPAWSRGELNIPVDVGRRLDESTEPGLPPELRPLLRAPFEGRTTTIDYIDPRTRTEYQMTCRPVVGPGGEVLAGLLVGQEIADDRRRGRLMAEVQRLSRIGCATYDRRRGWSADAELLALLEVSRFDQVMTALDNIVLAEDRTPVRTAIDSLLANGGRCTLRYRIRRPHSGDIRHFMCSAMAVVDARGELVRAIVTNVDVTSDVVGERLVALAARDRTRLLRRVSDMLVERFNSRRASIERITDVAAAALGGTTMVRVVALHDDVVELDILSLAEDAASDRIPESIQEAVRAWVPTAAAIDPDEPSARMFSSIDDPDWRIAYRRQTGCSPNPVLTHFISVPLRHDGSVLGFLRAFRLDDHAFAAGDDDLLQVIADRIGAVLGEGHVRAQLARQSDEGRSMTSRIGHLMAAQRGLLEQLANVEERERLILAEAIHDEPLQLIVAATMRLDTMVGDLGSRSVDVEELIELLEDAVSKLRTLLIALTPPDLGDGLGTALQRLAESVFVVDRSVTVEVTGANQVRLTPLRQLNACRILREALVNARKHARARHIWLNVTEADGMVRASVRDDGVGAESLDAGPGHFGLAIMRGRAAAEDGYLTVRTARGEGTTIILAVPVDVPVGGEPGGDLA